jgi:alpha-beta hydrolase superfamily lysophospholipase
MQTQVIKMQTGTFSGSEGDVIYYREVHSEGQSWAALVIVHGLGEHSGRYQYLMEALVPRGIDVYALDLRGHGRSGGARGSLKSWQEFGDDLGAFLALVREKAPDQPLFLMGHSLGGLIVLDYVLAHPFQAQGVITSSPALVSNAIPRSKRWLAKLLSRLMPGLQIKSGLDAAGISSQPEEVQRYLEDAYVHDWGTPRLGAETFAAQARTWKNVSRIPVPILILHGEQDPLTPVQTSQNLYRQIETPYKSLITYPGSYHEIHNDIQRADEFEDLTVWIKSQLEAEENSTK